MAIFESVVRTQGILGIYKYFEKGFLEEMGEGKIKDKTNSIELALFKKHKEKY